MLAEIFNSINAKTLNMNLGVECYLTGILATASVSRIVSPRPRPSKYVRTASSPITVLSEINEMLYEHKFLNHHNDIHFQCYTIMARELFIVIITESMKLLEFFYNS